MNKVNRIFSALLVSLMFSGAAAAATITVDFESLPGADAVLGTTDDVPTQNTFIAPIGENYAAIGLHFSQGSLFQDSFFDGNPTNHFISSTNPIGTFSVPVYGIEIDSRSYWNAVLTAYDIHGNILASSVLVNPIAGSGVFSGTVSVSSLVPIYSFSILPPQSQQILNLDNLVLTVAAAVPEPEQYAMLALGLMLITVRARRKN